ncbi:hypothetical protein H6503_05205 [Candidatus Woesearchaeota archaeon]|nr:hypothetical protein [Candidatus Woesearchaeota archaeon]
MVDYKRLGENIRKGIDSFMEGLRSHETHTSKNSRHGNSTDLSDILGVKINANNAIRYAKDAVEHATKQNNVHYLDMINNALHSQNTAQLLRIQSQKEEIFRWADDPVKRAYARACILLEDFEEALSTYDKLENMIPSDLAAEGLIFMRQGNHKVAKSRLEIAAQDSPYVRIALACLDKKDHDTLYKHLGPVLLKSVQANMMMGIHHLNNVEYDMAKRYFEQASYLAPESVTAKFYLFRTSHKTPTPEDISGFFLDTGCSWSSEYFTTKLEEHPVEYPALKLDGKSIFRAS